MHEKFSLTLPDMSDGSDPITLLIILASEIAIAILNHTTSILHPAVLFVEGYQFMPYLWIDLMVGMFLYWFSFLFYCIWYRIGTTRSLILLTVLIIGGLFLYYGGILGSWWLWFSAQNMQALATFTLLGFVSLLAMLATYPLMLDAPLQPAPGS